MQAHLFLLAKQIPSFSGFVIFLISVAGLVSQCVLAFVCFFTLFMLTWILEYFISGHKWSRKETSVQSLCTPCDSRRKSFTLCYILSWK